MPEQPKQIIIVGGSGGIGQALVKALLDEYPAVLISATYHRREIPFQHKRVEWQNLDVRDPSTIQQWSSRFDRVDWILNCVGFLHEDGRGPEKSIRAVDSEFLLESIRINTLPTLLLARYFATALKKSAAPVLATISARVGSIEDNRLGGWYSYRISKAALNMALKTLSIEWKHSHPKGCVLALHPGTNDTDLSKPFQTNVVPENLFKPSYTASMFVKLLSQLEPNQSGSFQAWDGTHIPW
jgi:NAD(P)-dependent dehydrogenase (short-subunit alcohol dehydrogenase family)